MTEWPMVPLGEVLQLQRRWVKVDPLGTYAEIGVRCFGNGIFHKAPVDGSALGNKRVLQIEPGDLVFNNVFAWEGAVAVASEAEAGKIGSHRFVTYTTDQSRCSTDYLRWFFKSEPGLEILRRVSPGSAGRNRTMSLDQLPKQVIPLPPLGEQHRSVEYLDDLSARINEAMLLRARVSRSAIVLWEQALLNTFNTIEHHSHPCRFGDVCKVVRGGSPRPAGSPIYYEGHIPFLKVADLTRDENKTVDTHTYTIKEAGLRRTRWVEPGTLMLTNSGATLGVPKICSFGTTFNDGIQAFLGLPKELNKEYLYYFLRSKTRWFRDWAARGQGQPNLNTEMVRQMTFPCPDSLSQARVVTFLDRLREKLDVLEGRQIRVHDELAAMLPAILHEAFHGETE